MMTNKWIRKAMWMAADLAVLYLSFYFAYLIKFDQIAGIPKSITNHLIEVISIMVGIKFLALLIMRMYSKIWRFAGITELVDVVVACGLGSAATMAMLFLISRQPEFNMILVPRSIVLIALMFDIAFIGGIRFIYRMLFHVSPKEMIRHQLKKRTLIYGAGQAGVMVLKEINTQDRGDFSPIGFLDDDDAKYNQKLHGLPIYGGLEHLEKVVVKERVEAIIVAMPSASQERIKEILHAAKETGVKISILPRVYDILDGAVVTSKLRPVEIEDLLGRDPVKLENDLISGYVAGKRVMVTGGGGSIGSELCRQLAKFKPVQLVIVEIYENNGYDIQMELKRSYPELDLHVEIASVRDRIRLEEIFTRFRPQVVFHAAAHKHVPLMEESPAEAIKNNVFGTRNVIELCDETGVQKCVLISTDKAVNPTNVMGASKRLCEMLVQSYSEVAKHTGFSAVRFGNVLGSNGSVIPLFKRQIQAGGPVTVTHPDIIRYFMTIPEAAQLVIQAGGYASGGEIFVLDMGEPVKIDGLARDLIRLSGFEPDRDIQIVYTGLRPGEKLYEELLMSEEGLGKTNSEKIFVAQPMSLPYAELIEGIESLADAFHDSSALRTALMKIVPTYAPTEVSNGEK